MQIGLEHLTKAKGQLIFFWHVQSVQKSCRQSVQTLILGCTRRCIDIHLCITAHPLSILTIIDWGGDEIYAMDTIANTWMWKV